MVTMAPKCLLWMLYVSHSVLTKPYGEGTVIAVITKPYREGAGSLHPPERQAPELQCPGPGKSQD